MVHPKKVPLYEWKDSWLKMTVAGYARKPEYLALTDHEKKDRGYPVSREEMIEYIEKHMESERDVRQKSH